MKFGLIDEHREVWPVRLTCAVLDLSTSGYSAWWGRPESRRAVAKAALLEDSALSMSRVRGPTAHPESVLPSATKAAVGTRAVRAADAPWGLRGLAALPRQARPTNSLNGYSIAPDRLGRDFTAAPQTRSG